MRAACRLSPRSPTYDPSGGLADLDPPENLDEKEKQRLAIWKEKVKVQMEELKKECSSLEQENRELKIELALVREEVKMVRGEMELWKREAENVAQTDEEVSIEYQEDYLLTSIDHILFEKQKQVYLISGIQNILAVDRLEKKCPSSNHSCDTLEPLDVEECRVVDSNFIDFQSKLSGLPNQTSSYSPAAAVPNSLTPVSESRVISEPIPEHAEEPNNNVLKHGQVKRGSNGTRMNSRYSSSSSFSSFINGAVSKSSSQASNLSDENSEKENISDSGPGQTNLRKLQPKLKLDLKKNYEYKPKRTGVTPMSCGIAFGPPWDSSFPPTPTPCGALRPSLSLHNLASRSFTEVLIPSLAPPRTHRVHPPNSSPISPPIRRSPPIVSKHTLAKTFTQNNFVVTVCKQ